jgi:hypothetical protein
MAVIFPRKFGAAATVQKLALDFAASGCGDAP